MRIFVFFVLCASTRVHCFRYQQSFRNHHQPSKIRWNYRSLDFTPPPGWVNTWQQVQNLVAQAPSSKLVVEWPNVNIEPNATTSVGLMAERPQLKWKTERGALYTVMAIDGGIKRLVPEVFMHWMVANIPGNSLKSGNEVMEYVTPFSLEFDEDNKFIKDRELSAHPLILLVFKQPGGIFVDETQAGCNPEVLSDRIFEYRDLVEKYNLELVAGNFLQMPYSGIYTNQMVCRISKCSKSAFPFLIPGVNDLPECQPREDIFDITVRGPKKGLVKEYSKYTSIYSLDSVTSDLLNLYPQASTGKAIEYTAIEGAFNAPAETNNLDDTLDGIVDATMFTYPSKAITEDLFFLPPKYPSAFAVAAQLIPTLAGGRGYKIIFSQPQDQDFDFQNLTSRPGMVFDLQIVKVKDGKETEFQQTRERLITVARNTNNILSVTKFDVERDILEDERAIFKYDNNNNEITIIAYESIPARNRAIAETSGLSDYKKFPETFDCIVCALMAEQTRPEYFPPFE